MTGPCPRCHRPVAEIQDFYDVYDDVVNVISRAMPCCDILSAADVGVLVDVHHVPHAANIQA